MAKGRAYVSDRVDQAHHSARATHVETSQRARRTQARQMKEQVARKHALALMATNQL